MTIVIDASAIVAIIAGEPEAGGLMTALVGAQAVFATPMNIAEAALVLILRERRFRMDDYREWLTANGVQESHLAGSERVVEAYLQYGKGVHRAGLNFGDCFAYALAKTLDAPLLFKGDDFVWTDVKSAL